MRSGLACADVALAQGQPGSTLKPFLYAQAIAEQRMTAASCRERIPRKAHAQGLAEKKARPSPLRNVMLHRHHLAFFQELMHPRFKLLISHRRAGTLVEVLGP